MDRIKIKNIYKNSLTIFFFYVRFMSDFVLNIHDIIEKQRMLGIHPWPKINTFTTTTDKQKAKEQ